MTGAEPIQPNSLPKTIILTRDEALDMVDAMLTARNILRRDGHDEAATWLDQVIEHIEGRIANPPPTDN